MLTFRRRALSTSLSRLTSAAAVCAALLACSRSASAATNQWSGTTDALWDTGTNWGLGAKPSDLDDVIFPAPAPGSGNTITLGAGEQALSLTFRDSYTLNGGDISVGGYGFVTVASGATATINSTITGENDFTMAFANGLADGDSQLGGGTLVLGGTNTYSGATIVELGVLSFSQSANLGDGSETNTVLLDGGTLRFTGDTVDLGVNRGFHVNTASTIEVTGSELVLSGSLTSEGDAALTKSGAGTLTLSGNVASENAGPIQVTRGVLQLNKTGVDAIGAGGFTVASSASGASIVRLLANDQISDAAALSLSASGGQNSRLDLNGFTETVGAITMTTNTNGGVTISTGETGVLILSQDLVLNNVRGATGNTGREVLITGGGSLSASTSTTTGTLDLGGTLRTITVNGSNVAAADATIETAIVNGGILKKGTHGLLLRGTNTYSGGTTINAGQVVAFNDNALGTGEIHVRAIDGVGELVLQNIAFDRDVTLDGGILSGAGGNNSSFNGTINVVSNSEIRLQDYTSAYSATQIGRDLAIRGELTGAGNLAIITAAEGTLLLAHDNSNYTGRITVHEGSALEISNGNALGATGVDHDTTVLPGASLRLRGGITVGDERLTVSGTGFANSATSTDGALRNLSGVNTWTSTINLTGDTAIQSDGGNLIFSNPIAFSGVGMNVTVRGQGEVTLHGAMDLGVGTLTKEGEGTLTFTSNLTANPVTSFVGGTLGFTGPQSFGASTIPAGLAYRFNSDPGPGVAITAPAGTRVLAGYPVDQALVSRLTTDSAGTLALRVDSSNPLDFSAYPGLSLGAAGTNIVSFSGALTPGAEGYRLGGGLGRLIVNTQLTGENPVTITGDVRLTGRNTFTGDVTVNAGGLLAIIDNPNLGAETNTLVLNGGTLQVNEVSGSPTSLFLQMGNPINPVGGGIL